MSAKLTLLIAATNGLLAVALGAFGAHGLKNKISANLISAYETAVQYHFYHALALLAVGVLLLFIGEKNKLLLQITGSLFITGILFFSGSLYLLALGGPNWLGPITPLGGIMLMAAWLALIFAVYKL